MLRYAIILQIALTGFSVSSHACSTASIGGWDAWQIANEVVVGTVVDIKTFNTEGLSKVGTDYPGSVRKYMRDTPYHDRPWAVVEIERAPRSQTGQSRRMKLAWTIMRWYLPAMPEIGRNYILRSSC